MLFKTIHGSHLYGLAHENSDRDYYVVVENVPKKKARYAKQSIIDGVDTTTVDFGTWLGMCSKGVPQALEAMFSDKAEVDAIADFRRAFKVGTSVLETYLRTAEAFIEDSDGDFKKKRHALRISMNANVMRRYGRFNPTLSNTQIQIVNHVALEDADTLKTICRSLIVGLDTHL